MDEICEVVITGPSAEWLAKFTQQLVDERLAACGHNLASIRSIYRWQGEVHDEPEARVMLHTKQALVSEIIAATREVHPFEVPCVLSVPISEANPDYHRWVVAETRDPQ